MRALDDALPRFDVNEMHSIWLVVGPLSGLIRRRWLRAVERACP